MNSPAKENLPLLLAAAACLAFAGLASASLEDVETAIIEKDYQRAHDLSQELLTQQPSSAQAPEAKYYLGLSELRMDRYADARKIFHDLLKESKDHRLQDKAHLGIIDSLYMEGQYEVALLEAQSLLKASPRSEFLSLIYLKMARANLKLARWDKAREYLNKIVGEFPESLERHVAKQLLEEKQYFAVQVGAFLDQQRAQTLTEELKQKDQYAYIVETIDAEGKKFYRVRVGQFAVLSEARNLMSQLSQSGYPTLIYP